jgi:phage terminase large subunit GpA-like protein
MNWSDHLEALAINNDESAFVEGVISGLQLDPELTVAEWADKWRILPQVSSAEPGRYRSSRTPYLVEIMDCLSVNNPVQEICFMKATQIGATECGNNWFCYIADIAPGPMLMIFPTDGLAKEHSKQKLQPTIQDTPRIKALIRSKRPRDTGDTASIKEFSGGICFLSGANSPVSFRSKSIRYLFLDDLDGFPYDTGEGCPVKLARRRTDSYSFRKKIFEVSTPTIKGISRIEMSFENSDQRYYHVPCPHCEGYQKLEWGGQDADYGIKFERNTAGQVSETWYQCKHCGGKIEERHKTAMLAAGEWVPTYPERDKRGYHLNALYSPLGWVSWRQIIEEFLESKSNPEALKVWMNTRLGEPWEDPGDSADWALLKARCEPYNMMEVPAQAGLLTAGVDTQDDRLAVVVRAWGPSEESWLIYHGEIYGDPAEAAVWDQLDNLLNRQYEKTDASKIQLVSMAVDSGGHRTQAVYNYARLRFPRVMAIRGVASPDKPVLLPRPTDQDVDYLGRKIVGGVKLWSVGVDTAKTVIYSRLKLDSGPGAYHWPLGTSDEYFLQLTSEKLVTRISKDGRRKREWIKTRPRNEALDCEVYCYAAAIRAGLVMIDFSKPKAQQQQRPRPRPRNPYDRRVKYQTPDYLDRYR